MAMSDGVGNFDDSELEDIMREMEALEKQGRSSWEKKGVKENDKQDPSSRIEEIVGRDLEEFSEEMGDFQDMRGPGGGQEEDEENKEENKDKRAQADHGVSKADGGPLIGMEKKEGPCLPPSSNNTPSQMSFNISGDMEVELSFYSHGHQVKMTARAGQGLEIEMGNGARFFFPFEGQLKKVA